ncbi:hypothetical protein Tco_0287424 [Tanacetum coccineum]
MQVYKVEIIDAGDSDKEDESAQDCFVLPIWPSYSSTNTPALTTDDKREGPREEEQVFMDDLERLKRQEKEANEEAEVLRKNTTPTKASILDATYTCYIPLVLASPYEGLSLADPTHSEEDDSEIPPLEDIYQNSTDGIFTTSSFDDEGAVADFTNLETVVNQRRNNHKGTSSMSICLFPCHHHEPKKISKALEDESWVDAMQEELMQFEIQQVLGLILSNNVNSLFLYGKIDEELMVSQPSQDKYVAEILKSLDFANVKTASTQMRLRSLSQDEEASECGCSISIGLLMALKKYLTLLLDLTLCLQFVLVLVSSTHKVFPSKVLVKEFFSDYAGANLDRKSTTGGCQFLGRRLISWQCKKQTIMATSTTEGMICCCSSLLTMAVLDSCPKHNMVAYLEKSEGNAEFHEIIDFLKRSSIHHALTMEGASSERPSKALPTPSPAPTSEVPNEPQTDSSPAQTSEVPIEHQPNPSPRPSPTTTIPDSIPETFW